jgi:3'-phosphoadenosine 5'-phosphosulfate sulfotransferase (PAPS reductase)/FAD synthetase
MTETVTEFLNRSDVLFVANHSGGKDSQATLIALLSAGIAKEHILVVHASLGAAEWPGALEKAREHSEKNGLPFIVARANKTLFDMVERRFQTRPEVPSFPSASTRQCTSDLKRDPIAREVRRYADEHGYKLIVNCLGLRAQESSGRAKRPTFSRVERFSTGGRTWYEYLPIHGLSTKEVFASIAQAGETPHYAYSLGNERLSCVFCIMASKNDLCVGAKHNPALLGQYAALEAKTGYTMHMSRKRILDIVFGTDQLQAAA